MEQNIFYLSLLNNMIATLITLFLNYGFGEKIEIL